ncbi:MAG: hypothetical protein M1825_000672 [Sarcosagium campestre]|nr:MAG: hypothetical protein M1825_000672 [Sarcosagium campestre]
MALAPKFAGQKFAASVSPEAIHTVELYLDYVCPFSKKMFNTLYHDVFPVVEKKYAGRVQFIFRQQIQPWHPSSTLTHEAGAAVLKLAPTKFYPFSAALFDKQTEFFDVNVVHETRNKTYERLATIAGTLGLDEAAVLKSLRVNDKPAEDGSLNIESAAHECLTEDALSHLKSYKYSSVDRSLISRYILKHYWNGFVELLPLWLAPNMVTLLGFCFILANVACLEIWVPDLIGPAPSWIYYSFAFGLWMYSTMDNVDGKQARRTGTSSGLGELFDHGIDSLNCTLGSLCETAAMGLGCTKLGVFTALVPCLPMFFSTWETYHTHTLYLGYFNGPTEGLIIACLIMTTSGYYGPGVWTVPIAKLVGHEDKLQDLSMRDLLLPILLGSFFLAHLPFCIYNVAKARRRQNLPLAPVFLQWTPMAIYTFTVGAWLYSPYSTLMKENRLVLFCLTMSFVFGRMTTKIILAHLTRQPFPYWTVMLAPLIGGMLLGNLPRFGLQQVTAKTELWYLRAYFVFALIVYSRWALLVINSICAYLGINCLTIGSKTAPGQEKKQLLSPEEPRRRSPRKVANGGIGEKKVS